MSFSSKYSEIYDSMGEMPQQSDPAKIRFYADLAPMKPAARILDVGCAEGRLAVELARRGHKVTGIDISSAYVQQAKDYAVANKASVDIFRCDLESPGFAHQFEGYAKFDFVYFLDVLEHLRSPVVGLENISSLLADSGTMFLRTPNAFSLGRLVFNVLSWRRRMDYNINREDFAALHLQLYDYKQLELLLAFVGLRIFGHVSTELTVPFVHCQSKRLARMFPTLADALIVKCAKAEPIDVRKQIDFWVENKEGTGE